MEARVTAIESRRGTRARRILLDGEPWRMLPADLVGAMELFIDDVVEVGDLEERVAEVEPSFAYRRAVALLSRRDYSITALTERLRRDGYTVEAVEGAVRRLRETGLLNDERYAEMLLRSLHRRGLGSRRVSQEFTRRGLDLEAVRVEPADDEPTEEDRAEDAARRLARPGTEPTRLAAKLVRRGFSPGLAMSSAKAALERLEQAEEG